MGAANLELERAIIESPDTLDAYLVYADWLQAKGDPRGELIAVQAALVRAPDSAALMERERVLFDKHTAEWLGPAAEDSALTLTWRLGFIDTVEVSYDEPHDGLAFLLASPVGRLVRVLEHETWHFDPSILDLFAKAEPSALREISLGDWSPAHEPGEGEVELGNLGGIWSAHRWLEKVVLTGSATSLGTIDAPELRHFEWSTLGPDAASLQSIASASWPELQTLKLWFARGGRDGRTAVIRQILDGKQLSKLKHLALRGFALPEELHKEIARSKILPQLETLDLGGLPCQFHKELMALNGLRTNPAFAHLKDFTI